MNTINVNLCETSRELDMKLLFEKYPYGPGPSMLFDFAMNKLKVIPEEWATRPDSDKPLILDAGGGYGRDASDFINYSKNIIIADRNKSNYKILTELYSEPKRKNIGFVNVNLTDDNCSKVILSDQGDNSKDKANVDFIYSYQLLHLLDENELDKAFNNFAILLRKGCCMLHIFLADRCPLTKIDNGQNRTYNGEVVKYNGHDENVLKNMAKNHGFSLENSDALPSGLNYIYVVELHAQYGHDEPQLHRHIMWAMCCKRK